MRTLKKIIAKLMAVVMLVTLLPVTAYADTVKPVDDAAYYTNTNGVDFTKEQYDRLREFYTENEIEIMQPSFAIPLFEHLYDLTVEKQYVYVQTFESVDKDGNVVTTEKETQLTEEQVKNLDKLELDVPDCPQRNWSATHETASKLITMKLTLGANTASVSLTCNWTKLPTTRSYDIMAIASSEFTYFKTVSTKDSNFSASVKGDGKITSKYDEDSSAVKIQQGSNAGIGVSVKLPDNATKSIECTMQCSYAVPAGVVLVNGTYQHSTSSISLSDSMKYNIKRFITSMGGVLAFTSSTIADKYDSTAGLSVSGSI